MTEEQKQKIRDGHARRKAKLAAASDEPETPIPPPAAPPEEFPPPQPAPGGVVEPEVPTEPEAESEDPDRDPRFTAFLAGLDPETSAMFTLDEIADIYAQQIVKAAAEKKAQKKKVLSDHALDLARMEAGLTPKENAAAKALAARNSEMITWRCDLPDEGAGLRGQKGIMLDQMIYLHGVTYTTTRAVYDTCAEIQYRAHQHEAQFNGKGRTYYNRQQRRFEHPGGFAGGSQSWHIQ